MKKVLFLFILTGILLILSPSSAYAIAFTAAAAAGLTGAALATAGTIGTVALVGGGAYALSQMTKQPKTPSFQSTTPTPPSTEAAKKAAQEETTKRRRAISRNRSVYTSPTGLTPADESNLATKTLLGE